MNVAELLPKVKTSLRIVDLEFDDELMDLIEACIADLGIAGINEGSDSVIPTNPLIVAAVTTYCKANFGYVTGEEYARLKASYDEQKAQMATATGYTEWTVAE